MDINSAEVASYDSDIAPTRRRLERNTYVVLAVMIMAAVAMGDLKVILGTVLGGLLGLLNYYWLSASLSAIIGLAVQSHGVPRRAAWKFLWRYLVIGSAIGFALWSGWFHLLALVAGFCAFVGALMLEAGYQMYRLFVPGKESME